MGERMRPSLALLATLVAVSLVPERVPAQTLALVFDEDCTRCSATAELGTRIRFYVVLRNFPTCTNCGLENVSFRIVGRPSDWGYDWFSNPLATSASDPFAARGATIRFDHLKNVPACLVLYTCYVVPSAIPLERLRLTHTSPRIVWILPPRTEYQVPRS